MSRTDRYGRDWVSPFSYVKLYMLDLACTEWCSGDVTDSVICFACATQAVEERALDAADLTIGPAPERRETGEEGC